MSRVEEQVLRQRASRTREAVAARVSTELSRLKKVILPEGVQPLSPGFFMLEALRANKGAKAKGKVK